MAGPDTEPTNGELGRRIDTLSTAVQDGFRRVAAEIEHVHLSHEKYVLIAVHNVITADQQRQINELRAEFDALQDNRRYAINTVLAAAALILSAIGVLYPLVNK